MGQYWIDIFEAIIKNNISIIPHFILSAPITLYIVAPVTGLGYEIIRREENHNDIQAKKYLLNVIRAPIKISDSTMLQTTNFFS